MRAGKKSFPLFSARAVACLLFSGLPLQPVDEARAQTVLNTANFFNEPKFALDQGLKLQKESGAEEKTPRLAVPTAVKVQSKLRHLPASSSGWRIQGETGSLDWRIYMTAEEAAETKRFRFAYATSASVLPEVSTLALVINNVVVGRMGIASPGEIKPIEFDVPLNALRPGFNAVRISLEQRHRVDCTVDATYELWSEMDPARSGFLGAANRLPMRTEDLAALRPRADGTLVIRVLFQGRMSSRRIDQTILAAQAIALSGKFERVLVSFTSDPDTSFGIDLVVGTVSEARELLDESDEGGNISGPTVILRSPRVGFAPMLIVSGATDEDVTKAVTQLIATSKVDEANGTSIRTAAGSIDELRISGGEKIRLADLGQPKIEFSGRFFRLPIEVAMPADFLPADYGKLSINLSGGYAPGLLGDAQVQVNLNGREAASVPLSNPSGGLFHHNDIDVPLSALRPGRNIIEIAAKLPNGSDKVCDGGSSPSEAKRFLLLGDSEIRFPLLARIGRTPELLQTSAEGYPYSIPGSHPKLYVPSPDRDSLSAAITLAVRLSVAARRPIPFELVLSNPRGSPGHGLVVAPARSLDPSLMRDIGMDPEAIRRNWEERTTGSSSAAIETQGRSGNTDRARLADGVSPRSTADASYSEHAISSSSAVVTYEPAGADDWALLAGRSFIDRLSDLARSMARSVLATALDAKKALRDRIFDRVAAKTGSPSLIVAQGFRASDSSDVITIVTAPEAKTLAHAVEALMDPARWSGLRGGLSTMDSFAQILETADAPHVRLVQTQPLSLSNSRLIVAGWLSLHPAAYVISAMLMGGFLAFATRSLVKNLGRRNG